MAQDVNNIYNLTTSLATSLSYYQLVLHIRSVLANLHDSLSYIKSVSMHIMDYINAATTGTLSSHILPLQTSNRCYPTLKSLYLPSYIYQYHLRIHYTFINTCAHMFSLPIDSFCYLYMFLFRTGHSKYHLQNFHLGHPSGKFHSTL